MKQSNDRILYISYEKEGSRHAVGRLYFHGYGKALRTTFTYEDAWLSWSGAFSVAPHVPLVQQVHNFQGLPGFVSDSAPDRWGRMLIYKGAASIAAEEGKALRTIDEYDYLVGVDDWSRMGAWRYSTMPTGPYVAAGSNIPKLITLPELLDAARSVLTEDAKSFEGVKLLLDAGTSSLGGAHPKATVEDNGKLFLAKFPSPQAVWDEIRWEAFCLSMAKTCGVTTPHFQLLEVGGAAVLLEDRFDRRDHEHIPFISALALLQIDDLTRVDYADIADAMRLFITSPHQDMRELLKRVLVNIVVHNVDDHARNHGLVRVDDAWRLSPAYDITVSPFENEERRSSIFGRSGPDEADGLKDLIHALGIEPKEAKLITEEVLDAFGLWENQARLLGCKESEIDLMRPIISDRIDAVARA